jgi:hypothetical protein
MNEVWLGYTESLFFAVVIKKLDTTDLDLAYF